MMHGVEESIADRASIHELLADVASREPDAPALIAPGTGELTYGELLCLVEGVCAQLRVLGIQRGDRVAIVLPTGLEMAVAFLSVSASVTSAPLNPDYTEKELASHLTDLEPAALVVAPGDGEAARAAANALAIPILDLESRLGSSPPVFRLVADKHGAHLGRGPLPRSALAEPGDTAMLLHTSGSTARPKLVPLTQRSICMSCCETARALDLTAQDRCLNMLPLFHVHGLVSAVLTPLAAGGSVALTGGFDPGSYLRWMADLKPTWYSASPPMHLAFLDQIRTSGGRLGETSLRFIRSGSSKLSAEQIGLLEEAFGVPLIEAYGMTEAPHTAGNPPAKRKAGSVGKAVASELAVMNRDGELLPSGETGEIVVRGLTVMGGYENAPEANASAFTNGWFRTGDQGRLDSEGYLFLDGRLKEIINRGGQKISPHEVERGLLDHPLVAEAAVFAIPDELLDEEVGAAVVVSPGSSISAEELRRFLRQRLAIFKIPRRIVVLDSIPKGPTGKLQRVGLAKRLGLTGAAPDTLASSESRDAPRNSVERELVRIWSEVLQIGRVGIHDTFLDLGGHSLLAMQVASRLNRAFEVEIPLETVFRSSTVVDLADAIAQSRASGVDAGPGQIRRVSRDAYRRRQ